jgi:hypothetical protein
MKIEGVVVEQGFKMFSLPDLTQGQNTNVIN